jgi:uncharacterized membrane protein YcfT
MPRTVSQIVAELREQILSVQNEIDYIIQNSQYQSTSALDGVDNQIEVKEQELKRLRLKRDLYMIAL